MNFYNSRTGVLFRQAQLADQSPFEKLFEVFKELITHTSGDFDEAIDWLRELDEEYQLTDDKYTSTILLKTFWIKALSKPRSNQMAVNDPWELPPRLKKS